MRTREVGELLLSLALDTSPLTEALWRRPLTVEQWIPAGWLGSGADLRLLTVG